MGHSIGAAYDPTVAVRRRHLPALRAGRNSTRRCVYPVDDAQDEPFGYAQGRPLTLGGRATTFTVPFSGREAPSCNSRNAT
jgi:hypothetical protein